MSRLISAEKISHTVDGQTILHEIDLVVETGDQLMITGPSGSGKTTLLHILAGLDAPSSGSVKFLDRCYSSFSAVEMVEFRKKMIGFVFQFHHLISGMSVKDNVMLSSYFSKGLKQQQLLSLFDQLQLSDKLLPKPVNVLSGGEKQRVALARALIHQPKILFADEPTGCLDQENAKKMWHILQSLNRSGLTIVMVTHDEQLKAMGHKNLHLMDGLLTQ
ncbi:MAG: ABC transporter ATP-binding protein [Gammaproteobacteria bacterium]|jgi:ABC-type lipoprotein export system ATPase subunit|nr:ABC transporter ATP-binding protein [Gammaproteobacteria bacterium]